LRNEYAVDRTCHAPMDVMSARGPRLFQVRVIHEDVCRSDEMQLHTPKSDHANAFLNDRHRRFVAFQTAFDELPREANFGVTIGPSEEAYWRLCEPNNTASVPKSQPALQTFFDAYLELRLRHQLNYANYKLTSDYRIFSDMPQRQSELLAGVSKFGIQFVIVVHLCVVLIIVISFLGRLLGYQTVFDAETAVTGIFAFAIIALAVVWTGFGRRRIATRAIDGSAATCYRLFKVPSCADLTLEQYFDIRDPAADSNNPNQYAQYVGRALGVDDRTFTIKQLL
jgi:hypothetical protein